MLAKFKTIRLIALDVDGVLTDGQLLLLEDGQMARSMNIRDGYALQLAVKQGYRLIVVSGGESDAVKRRLHKLGLTEVHMGISNKKSLLEEYLQQHGLGWNDVLYMGDDIPDLEVMQLAGLPCSPADAVPEIKAVSQYISPVAGGKGCVRDILEKMLRLNGHWDTTAGIAAR